MPSLTGILLFDAGRRELRLQPKNAATGSRFLAYPMQASLRSYALLLLLLPLSVIMRDGRDTDAETAGFPDYTWTDANAHIERRWHCRQDPKAKSGSDSPVRQRSALHVDRQNCT